jgi:hypothetical protein
MTTWITKEGGRIGRVMQTHTDETPGQEWKKVPNDWGGNPGDKIEWFGGDMRRIPDADLIEAGIRKDGRGLWYNKDTGEAKTVYDLDMEPGEGWTREAPMENEPYQKWDAASGSWAVDTGAKEEAEKERLITETKNAIDEAERRIQRSLIAKMSGTATEEDDRYFNQIRAEIESLREKLRRLTAA